MSFGDGVIGLQGEFSESSSRTEGRPLTQHTFPLLLETEQERILCKFKISTFQSTLDVVGTELRSGPLGSQRELLLGYRCRPYLYPGNGFHLVLKQYFLKQRNPWNNFGKPCVLLCTLQRTVGISTKDLDEFFQKKQAT